VANTVLAVTSLSRPVLIPVLDDNSDPAGGTLHVTSVSAPTDGTAVLNADGSVTYTPRVGFSGVNVFTYRLQNDQGGTADGVISVAVGLSPNAAFVASIYAEILGREPDPVGAKADLQVQDAAITPQDIDDARRAIIEGIRNSDESHEKQVTKLYQELLGRDPDQGGLDDKLALLKRPGATIDDVRANLLTSDEYRKNHPNYVADLYKALLKRQADPEGLKVFNDLLAKGGKPIDVVRGIMESDEALKLGITDVYKKYLGRQPEDADLQNILKFVKPNAQQKAAAVDVGVRSGLVNVEDGVAASKEFFNKLLPGK
jgi:hypothetical protein